MAVAQAVVPVQQTNVVVTQHEIYNPHSSIEQLGTIQIPVQSDDTGPPPAKKGRESTGKWKRRRMRKRVSQEGIGNRDIGETECRAFGEIDVVSALWRPLGLSGDAQDANL
ncbi:uncharacterized protein CEXT_343001 [Caerostris extrusa]|uniref:Uncharacterized protein n=1 Tax=Caerostris extrusa TaxID=172846 RepID=A0AAV4SEL1_CAEEX|nr:uncharacterized protein CEXT_343001 [Caerostris extrusa]